MWAAGLLVQRWTIRVQPRVLLDRAVSMFGRAVSMFDNAVSMFDRAVFLRVVFKSLVLMEAIVCRYY